jgi:hypothetical protein
MEFSFATDARGRRFCEGIVCGMVVLYGLKSDQALAILNDAWRGQGVVGDSIVFHEPEWEWAGRLANPNPYLDDDHPEQIAWKKRDDRAQFRRKGRNRPPDAWPKLPL